MKAVTEKKSTLFHEHCSKCLGLEEPNFLPACMQLCASTMAIVCLLPSSEFVSLQGYLGFRVYHLVHIYHWQLLPWYLHSPALPCHNSRAQQSNIRIGWIWWRKLSHVYSYFFAHYCYQSLPYEVLLQWWTQFKGFMSPSTWIMMVFLLLLGWTKVLLQRKMCCCSGLWSGLIHVKCTGVKSRQWAANEAVYQQLYSKGNCERKFPFMSFFSCMVSFG